MTAVTASQARKTLLSLLARVNDDHTHVEIISRHGSAVLMALDEFNALQETAHLLRVPANARRLIESMAQSAAHRTTTRTHPDD